MHIRSRASRLHKIILVTLFLREHVNNRHYRPADIDHQNPARTSHLRRVRLETDLDAQLLPFRRLVARTLCIKRIEHVVDVDH